MKKLAVPFLASTLALLGVASEAHATGVNVMPGNVLFDKEQSPQIGRGFNQNTMSFSSMCFKDIKRTPPSVDIDYTFHEVDDTYVQTLKQSVDVAASFQYTFIKASAKVDVKNSEKLDTNYKMILVDIRAQQYYDSMDEEQSTLGDNAKALLQKKDLVGFFEACGPAFVRSVKREKHYYALASFRSVSQDRDQSITASLQASFQALVASGSIDASYQRDLQEASTHTDLTIHVMAEGVDPTQVKGTLPVDIASMKNVIPAAIGAMTNPDTGVVTAFEIVPWIDNVNFQNLYPLASDADMALFAQRNNLMENSVAIAKIERSLEALDSQYSWNDYCSASIETALSEMTANSADPANPKPRHAPTDRIYANLGLSDPGMTVDILRNGLTKQLADLPTFEGALTDAANKCEQFLYQQNANKEDNMTHASYRSNDSCRAAVGMLPKAAAMHWTVPYCPVKFTP